MTSDLDIALPYTWSWSLLKHATTVLSRGTAPEYVDDGPVRAVGQAANQAIRLDWERTRFHDYRGNAKKLKGYLIPGDVLINSTGTGTLGRVGHFAGGPDSRPCVADGHITVARADPHVLDARYLYYWLSSRLFYDYVYSALVVGATNQIELNREKLATAPILAPPLREQRRIAGLLDAETSRLDRVRALQVDVESRVISRFHAQLDLAMDHLGESYGTLPFRRSIVHIEQGVSPQCHNVEAGPETWGVLKVSAVKNGLFVDSENKQLPSDLEPERRYEIRHGDLLITRANTPNLVGAAAIAVSPRRKLMLCDKIFRISTAPDLDREFLVMMSLSTRIRSMCAESSHGTSASMANLKTEEIKRWPIPRAPIPVQRQVTAELSVARDEAAMLTSAIDRQLALLTERRQALITAAVTGQIDVTAARGVDV